MTNITVRRASIWRETLSAVKQSLPTFLPWMLALGLGLGIIYFLMGTSQQAHAVQDLSKQAQDNPNLFKEHPELISQMMHDSMRNLLWMIPIFLVYSVGHYVFTVMYLRLAMKASNRPDYSVGGYFYWLGKVFLKYLRAFWILIPILGFFLYARAFLRYQIVSPLAVLKRGAELKLSWDITKGNWWRIFGNSLLVGLIFIIPFFLIGLVLGVIFGISQAITHTHPSLISTFILSAAEGVMGAVTVPVFSIFSCICYRVLSQEAAMAKVPLQST